jgi:hypothetical protein
MIAVLWGRQNQPPHVQQFPFDRCGTAFCFKGIIPEVTSGGEAMSLLRINSLPTDIPVGEDGVAHISIAQNLTVLEIKFTRKGNQALLPVGWLITTYGIPCQIELDSPSRIIFRYPFVSAKVRLNSSINTRIIPQAHVTEIVLHGNSRLDRCKMTRIVAHLWKGFASTHLYSEYFK